MKYLATRGITTPLIANRVSIYKGNMMIPITDGETVVGIKYRSIEKKLFSAKNSKLDYLVGWQLIDDFSSLIITEGEIDMLSCLEAGFENVVSIPSGVKSLTFLNSQDIWLRKFRKIIIATDNDVPGIECRKIIADTLSDIKEKLYKIELGKRKDLNEVLTEGGVQELKKVLNNPIKMFTAHEPFFEMDGCYFSRTSKGIKKITDFTLEVEGYSDNIIKGIMRTDNREKEFKLTKSEFVTKEGMVRDLGFFIGGSTKMMEFAHWIYEQNKEKYIREIEYYGFLENEYYDPGSEVICSKNDLNIKSCNDIESITEEELNWLRENLIYLRSETNQALLGISWALGRYHTQEAYPILEVAGTTSIGKTEYVEFISRLMFGNKENIKSFTTLTNHQIRSISSCSNLTPWVIDEVKITGKNLKERAQDLYSTIRAVYDNKTLNQGNTTSKLTEFKLKTPLIISVESELADVSVKNRMIPVKLTPHNKSKEDIFLRLKYSNILEKFAKYTLEKRLENEVIEISNSEARKLLPEVKDERQLYNGKCLLIGFKFLCSLIEVEKSIKIKFIEYLNQMLSHAYNVEENFIQLLELVVDSGEPYAHFYRKNEKDHYARFNMLYKAISIEHLKTNSTLELLDAKTLRKQLIECRFILQSNVVKKIKRDEFTDEDYSAKVDIFKF